MNYIKYLYLPFYADKMYFAEVQKIASASSVTEYLTGARYSTDMKTAYFMGQKVEAINGIEAYFAAESSEKIEEKSRWYDPSGMLKAYGIIHGEEIKDPKQMLLLLEGKNPQTGKSIFNKVKEKHMPGTEISTSVPKSVSAIWAVADDNLRAKIDAAIMKANNNALNFVSENASYTRLGKDGVQHQKSPIAGVIFPHGSARGHREGVEGDPHRHNHNLMFNITLCADGKFRTLENKYMMDYQKAIGAQFRASLAHELKALGFETERTKDGAFKVRGVPKELVKEWSTRHNQITKLADELGVSTKNKKAMSKLQTNSKANKIVSFIQDAFSRWRGQAKAHNFDEVSVKELTLAEKEMLTREEFMNTINAQALSTVNELVETESVFTRPQMIAKLSEKLTGTLSSTDIMSLFNNLCKSNEVILLNSDSAENERKVFMTTKNQMQVEAAIPLQAVKLSNDSKHFVDVKIINKAIAKKAGMSTEQSDAVRHALSSGSLKVIVGDAGVGKTFSADAIKDALQDVGYKVTGLAPAWKAAKVLESDLNAIIDPTKDDLAVHAKAIQGFILSVENGKTELTNKDAILIDEAGMIGSRTMHRLLKIAEETGAKVILTGDYKQLNAVEAGAAMKIVLDNTDAALVTKIRRQNDEWAREMVANLAKGDVEAGVKALDHKGFIKFEQNNTKIYESIIKDWSESTEELGWSPSKSNESECSHLILAVKNEDVLELNKMARDVIRDRGFYKSADVSIKCQPVAADGEAIDLDFAVGDRIVLRKNEKESDDRDKSTALITNKDEGLILNMDLSKNGGYDIKLKMGNGDIKTVNTKDYADEESKGFAATHAYAVTMYASQGMTVRRAFAVSEGMGQRYSYVGLSRHKESVKLYANEQSLRMKVAERENIKPKIVSDIEIKEQLIKQMSRKTDKLSTLDFSVSAKSKSYLESEIKKATNNVDKMLTNIKLGTYLTDVKNSIDKLKKYFHKQLDEKDVLLEQLKARVNADKNRKEQSSNAGLGM